MGRCKDQIIECMVEEHENLELALNDIEASGENFEWYVKGRYTAIPLRQLIDSRSPNKHCDSTVCCKSCFARSCFDWCLTHSHPSVEDADGTTPVKVQYHSKDAEGQLVSRTEIEHRRVCGHEEAREFPGDCNIVTCPFLEDELWEFEWEQQMQEMMARESP